MKKYLALTLILLEVTAGMSMRGRRHMQDYEADARLGRCYMLQYTAETWDDARYKCQQAGAKLAVPKSEDEFKAIQGLVRRMHYPSIVGWTGIKLAAWVGISNLEDYYVWQNIDGEDIKETGYSKWAEDYVEDLTDPKDPHCAIVDPEHPGYRSYWCHLKQPYICETELRNNYYRQGKYSGYQNMSCKWSPEGYEMWDETGSLLNRLKKNTYTL